jgi:putative proteasome-type protease
MRSNVTVGPPIELALYEADSFSLDHYRRFRANDPELDTIHALWERSLRNAVEDLPDIALEPHPAHQTQPALL